MLWLIIVCLRDGGNGFYFVRFRKVGFVVDLGFLQIRMLFVFFFFKMFGVYDGYNFKFLSYGSLVSQGLLK